MIVVSISNGRWINLDQVSLLEGSGTDEKKILFVWFSNSASFKKRDALVLEGDDSEKVMSAVLVVHHRNWGKAGGSKVVPARILPLPPRGES